MHEFEKCIGVELLENLHNTSEKMKQAFNTEFVEKYN